MGFADNADENQLCSSQASIDFMEPLLPRGEENWNEFDVKSLNEAIAD